MGRTKPVAKNIDAAALGARLRIEREAHGITLSDLALALGVSINTIRWHESGARMMRSDEVAMAAKVLRLDAGDLMVPFYSERDSEALRKALGRRMASLRTQAGMLQRHLVEGTAIALHEIVAHEAGARSLRADQLAVVALKLKVDAAALMIGDG
jgi:transcriptional regulator with XRE-family HTH domain